LILYIFRTDGPRNQRLHPYVVPIDPYQLTEFGFPAAGVTEIFNVESEIVLTSKPEVGVVASTSDRYQK